MRYLLAFLVVAGLWFASGSFVRDGGFDGVKGFLFDNSPGRDSPNWGDVAHKIGELSEARSGLGEEISEPGGEAAGEAAPASK
jgi:hypothetical protein